MGRQAKLKQKRKEWKLSRPPISELEHLKIQLNSVELKSWLLYQWSSVVNLDSLVAGENVCQIASVLLKKLGRDFQSDLNQDFSVSYNLSPSVQIAVGINVYSWTVWTFIGDCATGFEYATPDEEEFRLAP
jgi:hypothetical protein